MGKGGSGDCGFQMQVWAMNVPRFFIELVVELARKVRTPEEILKITTSDTKT